MTSFVYSEKRLVLEFLDVWHRANQVGKSAVPLRSVGGVLISLLVAIQPVDGQTTKSVTHGRCDARPTVMPGFHHSVAVLPLLFRRSRQPFPFKYTVVVAVAAAVVYLFAVYGCNGTEFSYVIFTEQRNFTTAERRNGNGMVEPGITIPSQPQSVTAPWPVPNYTAWWQRRMGVNNLTLMVAKAQRSRTNKKLPIIT